MDRKEKEKELQKLVSLTFDEKPEVRKGAAIRLAESEEPAAMFALIELSYDKDESVKSMARAILSKKSSPDKDSISFAEIFGSPEQPELPQPPQTPEQDLKKKKLLSPVEQIFERKLGKTKAALVKDRMMATIEKIYLKAVDSKPEDSQKREKSMQKMLSEYANVLSGLDKLMFEDTRHVREGKLAEVQTIQETPEAPAERAAGQAAEPEPPTAVLQEVGTKADASKIEKDLSELREEPEQEADSRLPLSDDEPEAPARGEKSIFRKAYDLMMACDGDEEVMFQQSQKLSKHLQEEVDLAFKMAKQRFKAENITHLTELKDSMRNVNTDTLTVKSAEIREYPRTKTKSDTYARIIVNDDEGSEGIIYLFEGRGKEVRPGMKVKVAKGQVKTFVFSGETALTVGKKGSVYVVL